MLYLTLLHKPFKYCILFSITLCSSVNTGYCIWFMHVWETGKVQQLDFLRQLSVRLCHQNMHVAHYNSRTNVYLCARSFHNRDMPWENLSAGVCDQVLKSLEILNLTSTCIGIIPSGQWTTKALIRLRGCADWTVPLLFAYDINRFSHDMAQNIIHGLAVY